MAQDRSALLRRKAELLAELADVDRALLAIAEGCKVCKRCEAEKPLEDFRSNGERRRAVCKECERSDASEQERNKKKLQERRKAHRRAWVAGDTKAPLAKLCPKCQTEKPAGDFAVNSTTADGLQYWCRSCSAMATRDWQERKRLIRNPDILP